MPKKQPSEATCVAGAGLGVQPVTRAQKGYALPGDELVSWGRSRGSPTARGHSRLRLLSKTSILNVFN